MTASVIVGVDGSPSAALVGSVARAVRQRCPDLAIDTRLADGNVAATYALEEARTRGSDLYILLVRSSAGGADPAEADLDDVIEGHSDVKIHREVRSGDSAAPVISRLAREVDAGLIVVGTRGLGGFRGLLVGGTARTLVDHAPCPLLVISKSTVVRFQGGAT